MFFDTNIIIDILGDSPNEEYLEVIALHVNNKTAYTSEVVIMELLSWDKLNDLRVSEMLKTVLAIFKVKRHTRNISLITAEIRNKL